MGDREKCAAKLAAAMQNAPTPIKLALVRILADVGGTKALATIGEAAKSSDAQLQDASSHVLGSWMTIDAAPVLLDLAKTGDKYRVRALRGYIRIARQFTMGEAQRLEMCQNALATATQAAEKKLVLDVLKRYRNLETLRLACKLTRELPNLNNEATQAALTIARELGDEKHSATADEAKHILSQAKLHKVKLEIVKAEYGASGQAKRRHQNAAKAGDGRATGAFAFSQLHGQLRRRSGPRHCEETQDRIQARRQNGERVIRGECARDSAAAQVSRFRHKSPIGLPLTAVREAAGS